MTDTKNTGEKRKRNASEAHAGAAEVLRLKVGEKGKMYDDGLVRQQTEIEDQVIAKASAAERIVDALPEDSKSMPEVELWLPEVLSDSVFVGHLVTDLDSVAGAIGAASLYGGIPALASEVNSETQFALKKWGIEKPRRIEDILSEKPDSEMCLVDHQQTSQMNPCIKADQIVGVIDHHALQSKTIVTNKPIYIDIRPWGSMSTIIAHTFITHNRRPEKGIAGMLLCAILSDTLNLQGPTTTDWDRLMVAVLAEIAKVHNIQLLAQEQFKAKSKELATLSSHALVNGDQKSFSFDASGFKGDIGFAVVETTDSDIILAKTSRLIPEMAACKKEKKLSFLFLAIVNIVKLKSSLLICGPGEKSLAQAAFGGEISNGNLMDLGNRVSRKKEFIPVLTRVINDGWRRPENLARGLSSTKLEEFGHLEVDPSDPYGSIERVGSSLENTGKPIAENCDDDDDDDDDDDVGLTIVA
uniref:inorganic diphosphatase n=1 Tax=Chaetoceros debilis TaxID=122233 RepID=A0A7S3Q5I3_9STRA|eukprot:CAMPEP_0194084050 /NCGR_PEP_ID=MMETSP0149-20130528/11298_1 /TAXON_ID=122233 /ORGANISM="Chaetoceros debilis, Strain MM31A-1" /LENGTH=469 /DNA_ID=CAMNT_0038766591 /DNA_START=26 /DNA_END=1435 /DNA_ORIENTATION=-